MVCPLYCRGAAVGTEVCHMVCPLSHDTRERPAHEWTGLLKLIFGEINLFSFGEFINC